jgi:hypothetical protein
MAYTPPARTAANFAITSFTPPSRTTANFEINAGPANYPVDVNETAAATQTELVTKFVVNAINETVSAGNSDSVSVVSAGINYPVDVNETAAASEDIPRVVALQ